MTDTDPTAPPTGYRPATRMDDSLWSWICLRCGANVPRTSEPTHTAWHQQLGEDVIAHVIDQLRAAYFRGDPADTEREADR